MSSMMSANTTASAMTISQKNNLNHSLSKSNLLEDDYVLYNHLPLVICNFLNQRSQDGMSCSMSSEDNPKSLTVKILMLVYEQNGFLFVCCPRLVTQNGSLTLNIDQCFDCDKLLLEEQNISLAYSTLNLMGSIFVNEGKSIQSLELFIIDYMPFGTLINNDKTINFTQKKKSLFRTKNDKEPVISIQITESISTSFQSAQIEKSSFGKETIFGTLTTDYISNTNNRINKCELNVDLVNSHKLSFTLPSNCNLINSCLLFDLSHGKAHPFNILHYRDKNSEDDNSRRLSNQPESQICNGKIFNYLYKIYQNSTSQGSSKKLYDPEKTYHVTLIMKFNSTIYLEEIMLGYFSIKFGFSQRLLKQVQNSDNSLSNLVIRDSIKASHGQVKNQNQNFVWIMGNKIPRSGKISLEFDLLIEQDKLANLSTQCSFRFDLKIISRLNSKPTDDLNLNDNRDSKIDIMECKLNTSPNSIKPQLVISSLRLITETNRTDEPLRKNSKDKMDSAKNSILFQYKLNSFEYQLYPKIFHKT